MASAFQTISEAYGASIDKVMREHEIAMKRWDVEESIEAGLGLFAMFERIDARWRDGIKKGEQPLERGAELKAISDILVQGRDRLLNAIEWLEHHDHVVEGASLFRGTQFIPFEDRPLDIAFSDREFQALAGLEPKAPEVAYAEDDSL